MKIQHRTRFLKGLFIALRIIFSYKAASFLMMPLSPEGKAAFLSRLHRRNAALIRVKALEMKGLMIKVGQFLSSRVDFLPDEYIAELSQLQDQVPAHDYGEIRQQMVDSLGVPPETLFRSFDETPIAAASLGQVHSATLRNGSRVAVKVQYPGIGHVIETDIRMLGVLVRLLRGRYGMINLRVLLDELSRIVRNELDYLQEGRNAERFAADFSGDERIVFPSVYWDYTRPRVLTLEFVEGIKITDAETMRNSGIDPRGVANLVAEVYAKMIFIHGFFHGDPHPGNIFVQEGPRLVFVDFGTVQAIPEHTTKELRRFAVGVVERDMTKILDALDQMGFIIAGADWSAVAGVIRSMFERFRDITPMQLKSLTVDDIGAEIERVIGIVDYLQIPNNFILLGRSVSMLNGIAYQLNPDINIVEIGTPYVRQFLSLGKGEQLDQILSGLKERVLDFWRMPVLVSDLLEKANRGELQVRLHKSEMAMITGQFRTMMSVMLLVVLTFTGATASLFFIIIGNRPLTLLTTVATIALGLLSVFKLMRK